jgi:DNA-binding beta-propeller fold protein YncE
MSVLVVLAPSAHARRALFAADTTGNRVFGFGVDSAGDISQLGLPPFTQPSGPAALVVGPDASHLYIAGSAQVATYLVSDAGNLGVLPLDSDATGAGASALAISPDGTRLFVANTTAQTVSRFLVNNDGTLTPLVPDQPTGDATAPDGLALSPDGKLLFVANGGADTVTTYAVSAAGALTAVGDPAPAGDAPAGLAVSADGKYLYGANRGTDNVSGWAIDGNGTLAPLPDSPYAAGDGPRGIAITTDGTRLLTADENGGTVSAFLAGSTGTLKSLGTTTGPAGARSVTVAPNGQRAYVGGSSSVAGYAVSPVGALSLRAGSPLLTNGNPGAIALTPDQAPQARFNAVAAPAGKDTTFEGGPALDADGTVTKWSWNFGDGTTGDGRTVTHTYSQPGDYSASLTVTDDEGCSAATRYTGQSLSCAGSPYSTSTQSMHIEVSPPQVAPDPPCIHDGDDGFCGTADHKAPVATLVGFTNGQSITTLDAPTEIAGFVTPDPSGIRSIQLRFTKAAGTAIVKKPVKKKAKKKSSKKKSSKKKPAHRSAKKKKKKKKKPVKKKPAAVSKVPMCMTVVPGKNFLVKVVCSKAKFFPVGNDVTFRYSLPLALGIGSYTVDVIAIDGAGNSDVIEDGRSHLTFKVIATPSNSGDGGGSVPTTPTPAKPSTPITDTGSPFG